MRVLTPEERRWLKQEVSRRSRLRAIRRSQRERWLRYVVIERGQSVYVAERYPPPWMVERLLCGEPGAFDRAWERVAARVRLSLRESFAAMGVWLP